MRIELKPSTQYFILSLYQCDMMGSTSLMIRKPALEVLHQLKTISQDTHPPPKFIFCILYSNLHLHLKYASLSLLQCAPCCDSFASFHHLYFRHRHHRHHHHHQFKFSGPNTLKLNLFLESTVC